MSGGRRYACRLCSEEVGGESIEDMLVHVIECHSRLLDAMAMHLLEERGDRRYACRLCGRLVADAGGERREPPLVEEAMIHLLEEHSELIDALTIYVSIEAKSGG